MLRRISFIFAVAVLFISFIAVPVNTNAYTGVSDLFTTRADNYFNLSPSYDGIYIFSRVYQSYYSPNTINSPVMLDNSYFESGTWNGQDVSGFDSKYIYDVDVAGFSQTVSYSDKGDYFIYSLITCLPVKAGDNFQFKFSFNTTNVRSCSSYSHISYIPGGSGCKMVHVEEGSTHPENPLSYTVSSKNQHLAFLFNPDTLISDVNYPFNRSNSVNCVSYPNLLSVGTFANCADIFTTSYNYTGDISVTLKDSIKNYSFSVYEIFTDGTATPGYDTEGGPVATSPPETTPVTSGGDSDETNKGILSTLNEIAKNTSEFYNQIINNIKQTFQDFKDWLESMFVPSDNNFTKCQELIEDKFKFINQIIDYNKTFINLHYLDEPPETYVTIYGETISFMNWDLYDKYKPVIDNIIVFCAWFFFIRNLFKRLPGIIGGFHT